MSSAKRSSSRPSAPSRDAHFSFIASFTEAVTVRPFLSDLLELRRQREKALTTPAAAA
ncbi:MAG TPA: hypothetical protein PKW35_18240 [Nannocystaceae bacterium]|nr:hypothetical protein [Nannocystaceae bacterium]